MQYILDNLPAEPLDMLAEDFDDQAEGLLLMMDMVQKRLAEMCRSVHRLIPGFQRYTKPLNVKYLNISYQA